MACRPIDLGDGVTGFVCSRSGRAAPCSVTGCTSPHVALCDFPLSGSKTGKTCDRKLCQAHRRTQVPRPGVKPASPGDSIDYCPTHDEIARGVGAQAGGASCAVAAPETTAARAVPAGRPGDASAVSPPPRRALTFAIPPSAPVRACRSCRARVVWIITKAGKRMPVEAEGEKRGESHFAHCAQADLWRGSR